MRALAGLILIATIASSHHAFAQAKKAATPATGPATRYFTYLDEFMDGEADLVLKQTRNGTTITAASLDLCYPAPKDSERRDRVLVDLKINGTAMSGAAESQLDKTPVAVALMQTKVAGAADTWSITGTIKFGSNSVAVNSRETTDTSEKEFAEQQSKDDEITPAPAAFTEVSPEAIAAKVRLADAANFVKGLRGTNIYVSKDSLAIGCDNLRAGTQTIRMSVNPDNAAATIAQLKDKPGVTAIGWSFGDLELNRTVRFAAKDWISGTAIDRAKIATGLTDTLKTVYKADSAASALDDISGKYTIRIKRPHGALAVYGLTEVLEISAMAAFDRPGASDAILLWVGDPSSEVVDETPGGKLLMTDANEGEGEDQATDDSGAIDEIAKYFKAQKWDDGSSKFK